MYVWYLMLGYRQVIVQCQAEKHLYTEVAVAREAVFVVVDITLTPELLEDRYKTTSFKIASEPVQPSLASQLANIDLYSLAPKQCRRVDRL